MSNLDIFANEHPAATGGVICQGHADYCAAHGHAIYIIDGVAQGFCSRCGDAIEVEAPVEVRKVPSRVAYAASVGTGSKMHATTSRAERTFCGWIVDVLVTEEEGPASLEVTCGTCHNALVKRDLAVVFA